MTTALATLTAVHLVELPVGLAARSREWFEGLIREFTLIHAGSGDHDRPAAPGRLMSLVDALVTEYGGLNLDAQNRLDEAIDAGEHVLADHVLRLPREAAAASLSLGAVIDEADRYCREGRHLLTLAEPSVLREYRRWFLGEVVDQLAGRPPTSWPRYRETHHLRRVVEDQGEVALASPSPKPEAGSAGRELAAAAVADLTVAGMYVPAGAGPEPVAGDFYDVLAIDSDLIGLVVGDVAGHGPGALEAMRRLRSAARATVLEESGPASVLARLDTFMEGLGAEEYATLWYGEYERSSGRLTYASAGHPPPALHADGTVQVLAEADAPSLGTGMAHAAAVQHSLVLLPGAVLVAYSDGLIERRGTDFDSQLEILGDVVNRACDPSRAGSPEDIAAEILEALVPDPDRAEDDVCLLVVRRQP